VIDVHHLARMGAVAGLWWMRDRATAHQVVQAIGDQRPRSVEEATAEVLAAAKRIDVVLSEHSVVADRARAALDRLGAKLATAQFAGDLKFFNRAYIANTGSPVSNEARVRCPTTSPWPSCASSSPGRLPGLRWRMWCSGCLRPPDETQMGRIDRALDRGGHPVGDDLVV
jgi:hypothetical protein